MSDDYKVGTIAILCIAIILLAILGLGYANLRNNHNFDVACIKSNKHLVYQTVTGQSTPVKECR